MALLIVVGALLIPGKAYAYTDLTPNDEALTIDNVKLSGDMLSFTVIDKESGLIQEIELNILDYYDLYNEFITIEVQNHDGSKMRTFQIRNPYYVPGLQPPIDDEIPDIPELPELDDIPEEPDPPNPLTPDGTGTVLDNANGSEGKEFFTVETPDGNIFYLVVDRHRSAENVYLLNAVTEQDLLSLAENDEIPEPITPIVPIEPIEPEPIAPIEPEPEEPPTNNGGNGTMIFIIIAVIIVGVAGYYFKIVRPKQNADVYDDDEDDEEDEASDDEEEVDIEDDDE